MEEKVSFWKKYFTVKNIALNGIIAGLYVALTIACGPLSYEFMQFRFSELFNLFVFFNPATTVGLTLGCLLSNLASTVGPWDILLGTGTTFVACVLMILYSKLFKNLFTTGFIPVIANAVVVPFTIYLSCMGTDAAFTLEPAIFFTMFGWVALGEFVCIIVIGYPIFMALSKTNPSFYRLISATRNMDFKW